MKNSVSSFSDGLENAHRDLLLRYVAPSAPSWTAPAALDVGCAGAHAPTAPQADLDDVVDVYESGAGGFGADDGSHDFMDLGLDESELQQIFGDS